jgi:hypothetical protein
MTDPLAGPLRSQVEMSDLFFPFDRQIDETGHPKASWQSYLEFAPEVSAATPSI